MVGSTQEKGPAESARSAAMYLAEMTVPSTVNIGKQTRMKAPQHIRSTSGTRCPASCLERR